MDALVEAEGLTRDYAGVRAVDGVDLRIEPGEVVGLLGANGAGKTSTLGMLCGTLAPTQGRVRIAGVDLLEAPRRAKRALGYLPEVPPLYPDMRVAEYLAFCARLRGLRGSAVATALATAVERCGLGPERARLIGTLSQGYRQRVGIAQAILHDPALVVLDEPTVGLDPIQVRAIRGLINDLAADRAVILSSHLLPEVQAVCSHVLILHRGRVAWRGRVADADADTDTAATLIVAITGDAAVLDDLPGVAATTALGAGRFRLQLQPGTGRVEDIAAAIVRRGGGLRELEPERRSLERIFVAVTAGAAAGEEAAT